MQVLLFLLIIGLFIALIIGLVNPSLILRWSKKPTRIKVFVFWFLVTFIVCILFSVLIPDKTPEEILISSKKDIENGDYKSAINDLKKIQQSDYFYNEALSLIAKADSLQKIKDLEKEQIKEEKNKKKLEEKNAKDLEKEKNKEEKIKRKLEEENAKQEKEQILIAKADSLQKIKYLEKEEKTKKDKEKPLEEKSMVGQVLQTKYFDIVVNKVSLQNSVKTGNEFADLSPEKGIRYLILNVSFKNTDKESRMLFDGSVWINYNGKDYNFDKSETVMLEGWGLFLDQINPLVTKTTNLVYKIPTEIKGPAYWQPGRAKKNQRIFLGNIE